eukprot:3374382-Amphidinium_carterae.1
MSHGCEIVCLGAPTGSGKTVVATPSVASFVVGRQTVSIQPTRANARNPVNYVSERFSHRKVASQLEIARNRLVSLAFKGSVDPSSSVAVIDEAHALSLSMTGAHLALRGVPKIMMTAVNNFNLKL